MLPPPIETKAGCGDEGVALSESGQALDLTDAVILLGSCRDFLELQGGGATVVTAGAVTGTFEVSLAVRCTGGRGV